VIFAFLFLMLVGLVSSQTTNDIVSEFNVEGCVANGVHIPAGDCSGEGSYFCDGGGGLHNTRNDGLGSGGELWCDYGEMDGYTPGDRQCCPTGFTCTGTGNCELNNVDCSVNDEAACNAAANCYWIAHPTSPFCSDRPQDFSCSVYGNDQGACEEDVLNLGQIGFGTENCNNFDLYGGRGYVAPFSSCGCRWVGGSRGCLLTYDIMPDIYEEGSVIDVDRCYLEFFSDFCIDGEQEVNWTAGSLTVTGSGLPPSLLDSMGCVGGSDTRVCGEQVIRLPGFSLFSFIASIAVLVLFYVFRREE